MRRPVRLSLCRISRISSIDLRVARGPGPPARARHRSRSNSNVRAADSFASTSSSNGVGHQHRVGNAVDDRLGVLTLGGGDLELDLELLGLAGRVGRVRVGVVDESLIASREAAAVAARRPPRCVAGDSRPPRAAAQLAGDAAAPPAAAEHGNAAQPRRRGGSTAQDGSRERRRTAERLGRRRTRGTDAPAKAIAARRGRLRRLITRRRLHHAGRPTASGGPPRLCRRRDRPLRSRSINRADRRRPSACEAIASFGLDLQRLAVVLHRLSSPCPSSRRRSRPCTGSRCPRVQGAGLLERRPARPSSRFCCRRR